jgi:hypothetical protein
MAICEAPARTQSGPGSMSELLHRATAEPALMAELAANPLQAVLAAGVRLTASDFKQMLGIPAATDEELLTVLIARLSREATCCGCNGE